MGGRPVRRRRLRRRTARGDTRREQRSDRVAAVRRPRRPHSVAVRPLRRAATAGRGRLAHAAVPPHRGGRPLVRPRCSRLQGQPPHAPHRPARARRRPSGPPQAGRRGIRGAGHRRPRGVRPRARRSPARRRHRRRRHRQRRRRPPRGHVEPARQRQRRGDRRGAHLRAALRHIRRCRARRPGRPRRHPGDTPRRARQHHHPRSVPHPDLVRCAIPARSVPERRRCAGRGIATGRRNRLRHDLGPPGDHHRRHRLPTSGRIGYGDRAPGQRAPQPAHPAGHHSRAGRKQPSSTTCARWRPGVCA